MTVISDSPRPLSTFDRSALITVHGNSCRSSFSINKEKKPGSVANAEMKRRSISRSETFRYLQIGNSSIFSFSIHDGMGKRCRVISSPICAFIRPRQLFIRFTLGAALSFISQCLPSSQPELYITSMQKRRGMTGFPVATSLSSSKRSPHSGNGTRGPFLRSVGIYLKLEMP